jgi:16S rRNA processing protein RimM
VPPLKTLHTVAVAKIIKEWGVKGEMKALPLSPQFSTLKPKSRVYLDTGEGLRQFTIESIKRLNKYAVISLQDISDPETALGYRGAVVRMDGESPGLKEGEFLYESVIGLSVVTTDGGFIGIVADIFETGSNDVYVVRDGDKERLIPAIRDVIKKIDLDEKKIIIQPMAGLLD